MAWFKSLISSESSADLENGMILDAEPPASGEAGERKTKSSFSLPEIHQMIEL